MPTAMLRKPRSRPQTHKPADPVAQPATPLQTPPNLFDVEKTIDMAPSEKLKDECTGCRVSFVWYRTSKQIDKEAKKDMAEAANTGEDGFSAAKRLMDSQHPTLKQANELRRRIEGYWRSMTLPLATAISSYTKLEPGVRLIRKDHVQEFWERMTSFKPEVETMQDKVRADMDDIRRMDAARLKGLYNPEDYSDNVALDFSWGFPNVEVPSFLAQLAPSVYAEERAKVAQQFENTFELATVTFLSEFQAVIGSWVDRLGPVIRIYPTEGSNMPQYHGAEVLTKLTHKESPDDVPEGQIKLQIRYAEPGKREKIEAWLPLLSAKEYADLQPSEVADEKKVFRTTTVEALTEMLVKFRKLGTTISASGQFESVVREIETHLAQCPTAASAAEELRDSRLFRTQTHALMQQLNAKMGAEIETFKKTRRHVDRGGNV